MGLEKYERNGRKRFERNDSPYRNLHLQTGGGLRMYFFLLSYPILGAGIKFIDEAFDEKTFSKKIALILAPILGVLWAYTMLIDAVSATILLAILCAVFFKGKIDNYAHLAGLLVILGIIFLAGVEFLILPLIVLALSALLDEVGNDYIDKKKYLSSNRFYKKFAGYFFDQRWLTKVAILGIAIIGVFPLYFFLAMVLFDGAYLIVRSYGYKSRQKIPTPVAEKIMVSS